MSVAPAVGAACIAAAATAALGVHPLIGALGAGAVLRSVTRGRTANVGRVVEPLTRVFLVPLFLVMPGLSLDVTAIPSDQLWQVGLAILLASLGKGVTAAATACGCGLTRRDALRVGALMNTRGLVELVVLNVGYTAGIVGDTVFSILLVMALVTTAATGPLIRLTEVRAGSAT